jgi:hypothetical protein
MNALYCPECGEPVWDMPKGYKLARCWNGAGHASGSNLAFSTMDDEYEEGIAKRLEYLRGEINAGRISWGEIAELQGLAEFIDPSDVQLLEWAGVPESV